MISQNSSDKMTQEPDELSMRNDIVFYGGFNELSNEMLVSTNWKNKWGIAFSNRMSEARIVSGPDAFRNGKSLRVCYPKGKFGPLYTGVQFPISFEHIETMEQRSFDSLYIRYYVKFEPGFDFRLGGKLPGIMGCANSWERSGGNQPDGTNGWTLRLMWREKGKAVIYAYLPPHKYSGKEWGLDIDLHTAFETGIWHCIEQYVKVNDIGSCNGKLHVWFDNKEVLQLDDVLYRTVDNDAGKAGGIYVSTFHGGNTADWAPERDSFALFDRFTAAREERVGE